MMFLGRMVILRGGEEDGDDNDLDTKKSQEGGLQMDKASLEQEEDSLWWYWSKEIWNHTKKDERQWLH